MDTEGTSEISNGDSGDGDPPQDSEDFAEDTSKVPKAQRFSYPRKYGPPGRGLQGRVANSNLSGLERREAPEDETLDEAHAKRWYAGYEMRDNLPDAMHPQFYGLFAQLSRFRPRFEEGDSSLIQTLIGHSSQDAAGKPFYQTLEAGWSRFDHNLEVSVFIFFTTNNYGPEGWGLGGFVQEWDTKGYQFLEKEPGNTFRPGQTFLPASHIGGPQQSLFLHWQMVKGIQGRQDGWYLGINGIWNGFFPLNIFSRGNPNSTNTLADHANDCAFYGEIFDRDFDRRLPPEIPQLRTSTDMGSGNWPREGYGKTAFIANIMRLTSDPASGLEEWEHADDGAFRNRYTQGKPWVDPTMYDVSFFPNSGTTMGSHCYIGGPGAALPPGTWNDWEDVGGIAKRGQAQLPNPAGTGPVFDALACICMLNLQPNLTQLFIMGQDGRIYNSQETPDNDWTGFNNKSEWMKLDFGKDNTPIFDRQANFAVVARTPDNMDVFGVAKDGKIYTTSWNPDTGFVTWTDISKDQRFPSGSPIAAVSRFDKQIDVFINAGVIYTASWNQARDPQAWTDWITLAGIFPSTTPILVLSRTSLTMNVFLIGKDDGHAYVAAFQEGMSPEWSAFGDIGISAPDTDFDPPHATSFISGGKIAGLTNGGTRMDLYAVATDHRLYTCTWTPENQWSGVGDDKHWQSIGYGDNPAGERVFDGATSDIVAVRQAVSNDMDVFVTGRTGWINRTHWNALTNIYSSSFGSFGFDRLVGGDRHFTARSGFRIAATSRTPGSLTVVGVNQEGSALVAERDSAFGVL